MKHLAIALLLSLTGFPALADEPPVLVETPSLADAVASGAVPPVAQRVPREPMIAGETPGRPGGDLRVLMAGPKDTRLMVVYGYARLVGYTPDLTFAADIAKSGDIDQDRVFTFHLREGHKWSDGQPFTAQAFTHLNEYAAPPPAPPP